MKTSITVPDSIVRAADAIANDQGISRSAFFRRAIETYIASLQPDRVRKDLDAVYTDEPSEVDDLLARMQWASLTKEDW